ncbi:MAG: DUF2326 domain-containing protein [Synechococcaceae cyanobacterium]|jgi:uncharacterized protein YydD (DUF2326 family)
MKLSKLYSNLPNSFPPIRFNDGLNVVLAEIRDPENLNKDTHNLGKTTIAQIIDFCLLKKRSASFFLFKNDSLFSEFVFFLEVCLGQGELVTIRRSVAEPSKISLLYSSEACQDASTLPEDEWNHWRLSFDKGKELLESRFGFSVAMDWPFRKPLAYALRLQDDYQDVFQLGKFRGAHADWKPFLAELVGLDGGMVQEAYNLAAEAEAVGRSISELEPQLVGLADSPDRLEGMILLRAKEVIELERRLADFDFKLPDAAISEELVNRIEESIAANNERRYHLQMTIQTIDNTLGETVKFDLLGIERVFADSRVYFGDQLKRDYNDLIAFLRSISKERSELLQEERSEITRELEEIDSELNRLNQKRMDALATLREARAITKFREHTDRLVDLKTTLAILERQREQMDHLTILRHKLSGVHQRRNEVVQAIEENITTSTRHESRYRRIRLDFGEIVNSVLDRPAVLSCCLNREGNIEFRAEILDEAGTATSADDGHTYRKLLCVAFDIAVFSAYLQDSFIHFVFHDGIFESLDDRKKRCLLHEIRERADAGLQQIITVIDSDLPLLEDGSRMEFDKSEVVRLLHDQGDEGRLFRMSSW